MTGLSKLDFSFNNFLRDNFFWRSFGNGIGFIDEDILYSEEVLNVFSKHERKLLFNIYSHTKKNIINSCKFHIKGETIEVSSVEFHLKYGWILRSKNLVAYLGKINKSPGSKIKIGNLSYFSGRSRVMGNGSLEIGSYVSIADGCSFFTSYYDHPYTFTSTYNFKSNSRIIDEGLNFDTGFDPEFETKGDFISIGSDCWLGSNVSIKNSVIMEVGAILGSGSFASKRLDRYGIYVGSPARLLKYRFSKQKIAKLMESKWWDWPINKIRKQQNFFQR